MRILNIMSGGKAGGAETFFVSLVLALKSAGHESRAVIRSHPERAALIRAGGVEPLELPFRKWLDFTTKAALEREIAAFKPDVVMTWMSRASAICPTGDFLRLARLGGYYPIKNFQNCEHLICNTTELVDHVVKSGWPRARASYLPNFARIETAPTMARATFDTPDDAPLLLALGRLHPAKALDVLIRALAIETRPYLWIGGEGVLKTELEGLARELGVADRVRFLGWRNDKAALFGAADICAFPSRVEPFGNVVLDAWGYGKPLVAAASTGPADLVRDNEDGLLVPIDDAPALAAGIGRVIDEEGLADRLVAAGRKRFDADFTEQACVQRYVALFEELLRERQAGHRRAG
ncbi:glycosyltransferase [Denitrobaculum tricleocarpae]|uniref:Glycosyltransferase n=1 Tax=Denitrobaculum tricleocarpae TaxID=2591009 RepID=A0A545TXI8_9PROT|nr:glycosyltransferase [Denitrobaculum tricleocarpae]TQV81927.1 glycosyltransferase [Denitrobaculum tricleocarpae]